MRKDQVNKTGKLNEDKLWAYKLTEDLFLSSTTVPDGQNHGMMMFVDFSGSMGRHMAGTIEQTLIQVAFCKKVGIPFDVYGFQTVLTLSRVTSLGMGLEVLLSNLLMMVSCLSSLVDSVCFS